MVKIDGLRAENVPLMAFETPSDEVEPFLGRMEIPARAVQGDQSATVADPRQDVGRHLVLLVVRINQQRVIQVQVLAGNFRQIFRERQVDPLRSERLLEHAVALDGRMAPVVPEEQHLDAPRFGRLLGGSGEHR